MAKNIKHPRRKVLIDPSTQKPLGVLGSDQKLLFKALKAAKIEYSDITALFNQSCLHLTRKEASDEQRRMKYLTSVREIFKGLL